MHNAKCRVYDKTQNCWNNEPLLMQPGVSVIKPNCVIQWWTGLLDINRKEIYEGDIVRTVESHMQIIFNTTIYTQGIVTWLRESFCLCQSSIGSTEISQYAHCDCCPSDLEIIGNIFDNPKIEETPSN